MGSVVTGTLSIPLFTEPSIAQDNLIGLARPVNVSLDGLGLGGSTAFTTSTSTRLNSLADQIMVFSGTTTGLNPSASAIYYYYQGHWALFGDPNGATANHGADTISAGSGFIVRKVAAGSNVTAFWQNSPTY